MEAQRVRSPQDVRAEFARRGISITQWARERGYAPSTVHQVISGRNACTRGAGHKIAIELGLKLRERGGWL